MSKRNVKMQLQRTGGAMVVSRPDNGRPDPARVKMLIEGGVHPSNAERLASQIENAKKPISRDLSWMDD